MSLNTPLEKRLHREAEVRQARAAIDRIDEIRGAVQAARAGRNQREIADILCTNQAKVNRMLMAAKADPSVVDKTPREIILRAFVYETPRKDLVEELKRFPYTFGEDAPYPHEGRIPGTWDQVLAAYVQDLISEAEFTEIRNAVA